MAVKLRLVPDSPITGGGADTVKVTFTFCGLLPATAEATATVAL
jgi:hypothetical protein